MRGHTKLSLVFPLIWRGKCSLVWRITETCAGTENRTLISWLEATRSNTLNYTGLVLDTETCLSHALLEKLKVFSDPSHVADCFLFSSPCTTLLFLWRYWVLKIFYFIPQCTISGVGELCDLVPLY